MSDRVSQEREMLASARQAGGLAVLKTFVKLSGPGWLQSAITLGGGSLAGALFLGVIGGYEFLWVQLFAMLFGVTMLCAISYVTLSTEESPFRSLKDNINPVLAWGWLIASLMANLVWVLPQYSLAYAAVSQNLMPESFAGAGDGAKYLVSTVIFILVTGVTLCYGKEGLGIKIYEWILKIVVASIVLCFMGVVLKLATSAPDFSFGQVVTGFIPNLGTLFEPASVYGAFIDQLPPDALRAYWSQEIVNAQRTRMIAAASAAVGINMTFLLPYSMLNKGWGKDHRGLAIFDLSTGMVVPFVLAVSCVVIASAYMFHGKPYEGLLQQQDGTLVVNEQSAGYGSLKKTLAKRQKAAGLENIEISDSELQTAALLINRDTNSFADSLSGLTGSKAVSNTLFGFGVLAMALSTISMLMLISGFVFSEMFGKPHGGPLHKVGILCGATGILWPALWSGGSKAFLAIVTSTIGYILLPIAFLAFFLMMNSRKVLGENLPSGGKRLLWNCLMGVSLLVTGLAAAYTATTKKLGDFPIGTVGLITFIILVIAGQVYMMNKHKQEAAQRQDTAPPAADA